MKFSEAEKALKANGSLAEPSAAFVRFASVYKDFQDIESFYTELTQIQNIKDS